MDMYKNFAITEQFRVLENFIEIKNVELSSCTVDFIKKHPDADTETLKGVLPEDIFKLIEEFHKSIQRGIDSCMRSNDGVIFRDSIKTKISIEGGTPPLYTIRYSIIVDSNINVPTFEEDFQCIARRGIIEL